MNSINLIDLKSVLVWLAGAGGSYVTLYALSLVVENWAKWQTLPRFVKFITPLIVAVLVSLGANVLLGYSTIVEQIAPWYQIVAAAIIAYLGSQKGLMNAKSTGYGVRFKARG